MILLGPGHDQPVLFRLFSLLDRPAIGVPVEVDGSLRIVGEEFEVDDSGHDQTSFCNMLN
jgi:hypothetical protein